MPTKEEIPFHQDHTETNSSITGVCLLSPMTQSIYYSVLKELSPGKVVHTCNPLRTHEAETEATAYTLSPAALHSEFQANWGYLASCASIKQTAKTCHASLEGELVSAVLREHQQKPKAVQALNPRPQTECNLVQNTPLAMVGEVYISEYKENSEKKKKETENDI